MKAEFYLTLLDGLLATAVYYPRKQVGPAGPGHWIVSLGRATGAPVGAATSTMTSFPADSYRLAALPTSGIATSATPVCGFRMALHG